MARANLQLLSTMSLRIAKPYANAHPWPARETHTRVTFYIFLLKSMRRVWFAYTSDTPCDFGNHFIKNKATLGESTFIPFGCWCCNQHSFTTSTSQFLGENEPIVPFPNSTVHCTIAQTASAHCIRDAQELFARKQVDCMRSSFTHFLSLCQCQSLCKPRLPFFWQPLCGGYQ